MRKSLLLVVVLLAFLAQSCYSYKSMDNDPSKMEAGRRYRIERNHKNYKVTFNSLKDSSILVTRKDFTREEIPIKEITGIKKRKFSVVTTVALPITIAVVTVGIFALTYDGPDVSFGNINPPKH